MKKLMVFRALRISGIIDKKYGPLLFAMKGTDHRLASYGLQAKSGLLSVLVNKVLLEHSLSHLFRDYL